MAMLLDAHGVGEGGMHSASHAVPIVLDAHNVVLFSMWSPVSPLYTNLLHTRLASAFDMYNTFVLAVIRLFCASVVAGKRTGTAV